MNPIVRIMFSLWLVSVFSNVPYFLLVSLVNDSLVPHSLILYQFSVTLWLIIYHLFCSVMCQFYVLDV